MSLDSIDVHAMGEDMKGFVAGWIGGCAGLIASHPTDTVRIRMQTQGDSYSSAVECFWNIIKKEKVLGLFKGMTYPLLGQGAINATVFGVESMVYQRLAISGQTDSKRPSVRNSIIAGSFAGAVQTIIACPMELVKIRMQNQSIGQQHASWAKRRLGAVPTLPDTNLFQGYKGPIQTTLDIIRSDGVRGIYKGWWLTLFREIPQFGIYFGTYSWLRLKFASLTDTPPQDLGVLYLALAGGLTGIATWTWYPVDVIKTRFQYDGANGDMKYRGVLDCARKSVQLEGIGIFVKGLQPTLVRGFINGFATLPVVTLAMRFMNSNF